MNKVYEVYVESDYTVLVYKNNELVGYLIEYCTDYDDAMSYAKNVVLELQVQGRVYYNNKLVFDTSLYCWNNN